MTEGQRERELSGGSPDAVESARVGYQQALALWAYEHSQVWSKFTALIYANTIVLATIGLVATGTRHSDLRAFRVLLAILGLVMCSVWVVLTKRSFDYAKYWVLSARELEEQHLAPVQTLRRGGRFAAGEKIELDLSTGKEKHRIGAVGRIPVQVLSYVLITVFAALYAATICLL